MFLLIDGYGDRFGGYGNRAGCGGRRMFFAQKKERGDFFRMRGNRRGAGDTRLVRKRKDLGEPCLLRRKRHRDRKDKFGQRRRAGWVGRRVGLADDRQHSRRRRKTRRQGQSVAEGGGRRRTQRGRRDHLCRRDIRVAVQLRRRLHRDRAVAGEVLSDLCSHPRRRAEFRDRGHAVRHVRQDQVRRRGQAERKHARRHRRICLRDAVRLQGRDERRHTSRLCGERHRTLAGGVGTACRDAGGDG